MFSLQMTQTHTVSDIDRNRQIAQCCNAFEQNQHQLQLEIKVFSVI